MSEFKLTTAEINAIIAGATKLERDDEPTCQRGDRIVVLREKQRWAGRPGTAEDRSPRWKLPRKDLITITIRQIHEPKPGGRTNWQIRFDREDLRPERDLYLAKVVDHGDYTSNADPERLSDDLAIPDPEETRKQEMKKRLKLAEETKGSRGRSELAMRNQERAAREELRGVLRGLDPTAQERLLAAVMREIRAAKSGKMAA